MRAPRIPIVACAGILLGAGAACHETPQVEAGALLLSLTVAPGAAAPDELRVSVYDDTGALWQNARIPAQGSLAPSRDGRLGTVLVQPSSSQGILRIDIRGLVAGSPALEGLLVVPPSERVQATFDVSLQAGLAPDGDGDGVPDQIDDCPATPDPQQTGCAGDAAVDLSGGGGGAGGNTGGVDAAGGDALDGGAGCDVDGGCNKGLGVSCGSSAECASTFCVDGICCSTACIGPCRSCNQPSSNGACAPYPLGTDPEVECSGGNSCNGAGACGPPPGSGSKTDGQLCGGAGECSSGFCKDGLCCNSACTGACQTCATGSCQAVTKGVDAPECVAPMTCNARGKCVAQ